MLKVIFYLKAGKANKKGESPIFARISYNQQSITMATGKSILKERWQFTKNLRNVLKLEKEKVLKHSLDLFQLNIEKKFNEMAKVSSDISLLLVKNEFNGKTKIQTKGVSIVEILEKHNTYFEKKVNAGERSKASFQKYERSKELLVKFMKQQYRIEDLPTNEISSAFIYNLESYLKYESDFKGKIGIKNNSMVKYMRMYKTSCNYCIRMGLIDKNPFDLYDGKLNIKDAVFLTQNELDRIENKKFSFERLERVKDVFLFSCYTGYAPVDASNLTSTNIFQDSNDAFWIMTNRAKTAIRANVPILPPTMKIINKYKNLQIGLIPQISNQKMNAYLKEIADLCGIDKNLTWYVARHTFATTVTLGNGVRIENVSSMMGHTNIKQTQHYAKVLDVNVMEDMSKLKQKYS
ncbi:phage integrase SAM-like domain-containing protein [Flavobacterium sp. LB2P84]|uniref:Phage integrase SAM-like domain-containing protein n=1 Tax=Flavobacterium yafengii TaxID=3041253 RepID=A0AAW6TN65_9FLAO|nr:site-specific integrase [Flavobacterium yafengii]MDI5950234.1 phage integrase SAM-like domain-containing protein [Flavobacterium yafengii]MDI6033384.1 phage integrase SAM-like domain-containing protein [Flavobacterium yafengii]